MLTGPMKRVLAVGSEISLREYPTPKRKGRGAW